MKKIVIAGLLCLWLLAIAACGEKAEETTPVTADQVMVNIGQDLKGQAGDIIDASQKAVYSSYAEVCDDYSEKLSAAFTAYSGELKKDIEDGKDTNALVTSYTEMTKHLSEIAKEGIDTMTRMSAIDPTLGDYKEYSSKLDAIYQAYDQQLNKICNDNRQ